MRIKETVKRYRVALLAAASGTLLMSVTGCHSQSRTGMQADRAEAQTVVADGAQVMQASWAPTGVSWSSARTMEVKDPGVGETAFTVAVPSGWKAVGLILRPGGCYRPSVPADGLSYTVLGPDGYTAVGQLPGSSWSWASDGSNLTGSRCAPIGINTAAGFLLNIAVPNIHPDATNVRLVPPTAEMQTALENARQQSPRLGPTHRLLDFARVRMEYRIGDQPMEEIESAVLDCMETSVPAYPMMHRAGRNQRMCSIHGTGFRRAPKGELDELLASQPPGPKVDQAWDQQISQQMRTAFAQYKQASDAQFAAIQKHFADVTQGMLNRGRQFQQSQQNSFEHAMAADRATQDATDHAAHLQVLDSLNRQDFIDPSTGRKIETSNQYTHNWISSDKNSVVLGSDPTFDPNGVVDPIRESWTELIPAN